MYIEKNRGYRYPITRFSNYYIPDCRKGKKAYRLKGKHLGYHWGWLWKRNSQNDW